MKKTEASIIGEKFQIIRSLFIIYYFKLGQDFFLFHTCAQDSIKSFPLFVTKHV